MIEFADGALLFIEVYTCMVFIEFNLIAKYTKTLCCDNLRLKANQNSQEVEQDLL